MGFTYTLIGWHAFDHDLEDASTKLAGILNSINSESSFLTLSLPGEQ